MFELTHADLLAMEGGGGQPFVHFVDSLIEITAILGKVPLDKIRQQLRVNIADGGVDSAVDVPVLGDTTGWFSVPTIWQFKSVAGKEIDGKEKEESKPKKSTKKKPVSNNELQKEINKPYVQKLIKAGYGYRYCIRGDLTPEKQKEWEDQLNVEARKINPNCEAVKVLHGESIRKWANQFPAVIARLRPTVGLLLHWDAWSLNLLSVTPTYVTIPNWGDIVQKIEKHIDLSNDVKNVCLNIGGGSGVGKTRLVLETFANSIYGKHLVLYAADGETGKSIAAWLANQASRKVLLVVDECDMLAYTKIESLLHGHSDRIRVVTINNINEKLSSTEAQIWLQAIDEIHSLEILSANFKDVPEDRRRKYARFARGFIRLAADLCENDADIVANGLESVLENIESYIRTRLSDDEKLFVSLLALFQKIGFQAEFRNDLNELQEIINIPINKLDAIITRIHNAPGFIAIQGRFCYVTPEIVQKVMFSEGYRRWVVNDPQGFLKKLSPELAKQFLQQANQHGGSEVRTELGEFFRSFFNNLTSEQLRDGDISHLIATVTELLPIEYLPILRHKFENLSIHEIFKISGDYTRKGWGPRRTFVWLFERLSCFEEFFSDSELCLYRLALAENENNIGNNATATWQGLFSVWLSGTGIPFSVRFQSLRTKLSKNGYKKYKLTLSGIKRVLGDTYAHMVGPPIVAGRLRPRDWQPRDYYEAQECYKSALSALEEQISGKFVNRRNDAVNLLFEQSLFIIKRNLYVEMDNLLQEANLTEFETRKLRACLEQYIEYYDDRTDDVDVRKAVEYVKDWIIRIEPSDIDGKLRVLCGREPWERREENEKLFLEMTQQILQDPSILQRNLSWLASKEARSAERLAFTLGMEDQRCKLSEMIFFDAIRKRNHVFVRGYIRGVIKSGRQIQSNLLDLVDLIETRNPQIAASILEFGGEAFDGLSRILKLIDSGHVTAEALNGLALGYGARNLTRDEMALIMPYYIKAADSGDLNAAYSGIRFLSNMLNFEERHLHYRCFEDRRILESAWQLVELSSSKLKGRIESDWAFVLERLVSFDPFRTASFFSRMLLSENYSLARRCEEELAEMATSYPREVMHTFGESLLHKDGWKLQVSVLREIVEKIPPEIALQWMSENGGLVAAKRIARHLPKPYRDSNGKCIVPPILEAVLETYPDKTVLSNFSAGAHSGEVWSGNPAERFRTEAESLKQLLNHASPLIRQWAIDEIAYLKASADREDLEHAEDFLPGE